MLDEPTPSPLPPLEPALEDAEQLLRESLSEVCHTDPRAADTGEMIRLDEMLAIAGEAAKRAVSLRRRMRQEGRAAPRAKSPRRATGSRSAGASTAEGAAATPTTGARKSATPRSNAAASGTTEPAAAAPTADAPQVAAGATPDATTPPAATTATPANVSETPVSRAPSSTPTSGIEGAALASSGSEHRTFRDSHGVTWSVWAVHPQEGTRRAGLRGTFVQGWLAFVCEAEKRRLSPVPDGWMEADDAELERLCGAAEVAKPEALTRRMPPVKDEEGPRA